MESETVALPEGTRIGEKEWRFKQGGFYDIILGCKHTKSRV